MADNVTTPRSEDLVSVGSRISWGAIFAGAILALGIYSLLTILGGAVGISIGERVTPTTLKNSAIAWALITMVASVFVGGMVVSQFTVGENKMEAMLYGVIMWALLFGLLSSLGALGIRAGFNALIGMAHYADAASLQSWDRMARDAGVPPEQIENWRRGIKGIDDSRDLETRAAQNREAVTRLTWYAFAGTWISMIAAALGGLVGAGPQFKVVRVRTL
jgi:hypothetical protein